MIGAILGGAAALGQNYFQRKSQDRQNQANRELAEYTYSKDLEMWNRTNQYNDPSQQMARLKKAGINPNSIYGTSSATGNAGSTTAKYNTPTAQFKANIDLPQMIGQIAGLRKTNAETNLINQTANQKDLLFPNIQSQQQYKTEKEYMEHLYRNRGGEGNEQYFKDLSNLSNILRMRSNLANQGQTFSDNVLAKMQGKILQKMLDNVPMLKGIFSFNR